ncbi:MAG: aminotransferase class V-fold PLP-dependent enzyme [Dehalobacterium sp.]
MPTYLDNAATSFPKPPQVIDAVCNYMKNNGATAGRGAYQRALEADRLVYRTRKLICELFHHSDPSKVIFTANVTEALNLAIQGIVREGDHVITSSLEHNAVWRCLKTLERDKGISISTGPCSIDGVTQADQVKGLIIPKTTLIIFTHASNVLGTIQPVGEIGAIAREYGIPFLVDSAQTAGAIPIDVNKDHIDLLAFTGHKSLLGPMGTGGLVINCNLNMVPLKSGGTGGDSAYEYQPEYLPNRFEVGTPNVSGIVGLGEGINYILKTGIENIRAKEGEVLSYALQRLSQLEDVIVYGPRDPKKIAGVISFNYRGVPAEEIAYVLDQVYEIMVRAGLHCAPTAHKLIGSVKTGTVRIGIGYFNEKSDIDNLVSALEDIKDHL